MPHMKSAKKRVRQTKKRTAYNKSVKTRIKSQVHHFLEKVMSGDMEGARSLLSEVSSSLQSAATKGVLHRNTASRKVSRLAKRLRAPLTKTVGE